jgi:hypothetical protein
MANPTKDDGRPIDEADMPASRPGAKTWIILLIAIVAVTGIVYLPDIKSWMAMHF